VNVTATQHRQALAIRCPVCSAAPGLRCSGILATGRQTLRPRDGHAARWHELASASVNKPEPDAACVAALTATPGRREDARPFVHWLDGRHTFRASGRPGAALTMDVYRDSASLALALVLRDRMRQLGARGLAVAAAYRPAGGEDDSRHKHNAALDLDLLPGDARFGHQFARVAAELWRERKALRVGLGTYAPDGALWTNRVHLDTGWRHRCWQGTGRSTAGRYLFSRRPAALALGSSDEAEGQ
jgi:hypothetical protein